MTKNSLNVDDDDEASTIISIHRNLEMTNFLYSVNVSSFYIGSSIFTFHLHKVGAFLKFSPLVR